jgi:predicted metal-dependent phosphoesterase TrpH
MNRLKTDLHLHTGENPIEKLDYSAFDLIDEAHRRGFHVLSITNHEAVTFTGYLKDYAREKDILLIPGIELSVCDKHILIYNIDISKNCPRTFEDLGRLRDRNTLVIAPHPYYPWSHSLFGKLFEWIHVFDAIEYCHFYLRKVNFNTKAVAAARRFGLPLVGTSDAHMLSQLNTTYSYVEAEKETEAVFEAIRKHRVELVTSPLPVTEAAAIGKELFRTGGNAALSGACSLLQFIL